MLFRDFPPPFFLLLLFLLSIFPPISVFSKESASGFGIFDVTAIEPDFASGHVEASQEENDFLYDLFLDVMGRGVVRISSQKTGSWSFSCKAKWMNRESVNEVISVGLGIGQQERFCCTIFHTMLGYPLGRLVNTVWMNADGQYANLLEKYGEEKTFKVSNPEKGIYLRIVRIAPLDLIISECSLDGIEWILLHKMRIEMDDRADYFLFLSHEYENEIHAHAQLSDVTLQPVQAIANRLIDSEWISTEDRIEVVLRVLNLEAEPVNATVRESIAEGWKASNITNGGEFKNGVLTWAIVLDSDFTYLGYTLHPPVNAEKSIPFRGDVDSLPVLGVTKLGKQGFDFLTIFLTTLIAAPIVLVLLHLSLFLFYPRFLENLYNALFLSCIAAMNYLFFIRTMQAENFDSNYNWKLMSIALTGEAVFLLLFFYSLAYSKILKRYWLFLLLGILSLMLQLFQFNQINIGFFLLCIVIILLESARTLIASMKSRKKGIWVIVSGALIYIVALIWSFAQSYLALPEIPEYYIGVSQLLFLFSISVYLSYRFAKTNKDLSVLTVDLEKRVKQRTHQLEQANEELRELDKMKSAFVSQASHDLRTPLTAIKGSLDNLLLGIAGDLNEKQQKVMTRATKSVDRLTNLINDVLDLNRIETGRIVLEKTDIPFKALVENIIHENRPAAEQKQIKLSYNTEEGDYTLHIDGGKMERVVGELVSNAIKYTLEYGTVDVKLSHDDQQVSLSVKDTGIGMTKEECEKIWDRFYRTTASKKFAKGSGLGLSIAKELVELHGGALTVESEVEKGATFKLSLPRKGD